MRLPRTGYRGKVAFLALLTVVIAALVSSCSRGGVFAPGVAGTHGKSDRARAQTAEVYRGHAVFGHEVRSLRLCGSNEVLWLTGNPGFLSELHAELTRGMEPYSEVFVAVEGRRVAAASQGFGAEYTGAVHVEAVLYAGIEGPGCDAGWERFRYRAMGNEPFWSAEVSSRGLHLTRLGEAELQWENVVEEDTAAGLRFTVGGDEAAAAELLIEQKPCRDTMSGAFFALSGTFRLGDRSYAGCVLSGTEPGSPGG